jgi:LPS-assembly lipoprotein
MKPSHRHLQFGAAAVGLLGLGGCGFTPLYAVSGVTPQLASVDVSRPSGRTGYLIGQFLDSELGRAAGGEARYRLDLQLREVRVARGINVNNVATQYEVDLIAIYQLADIQTRKQVTKGVVSVNATYDTATQPYASVADELDAESRAAETAAQRIRLELATYFASPRPAATVVPTQGPTTSPFLGVETAEPMQSPRERAGGAADPGAGDLPDPYGVGGATAGPASP